MTVASFPTWTGLNDEFLAFRNGMRGHLENHFARIFDGAGQAVTRAASPDQLQSSSKC